MNGYQRVRIVGAPGFEDFEADLIMEIQGVDNRPLSIVGAEFEGEKEVFLFLREYVRKV